MEDTEIKRSHVEFGQSEMGLPLNYVNCWTMAIGTEFTITFGEIETMSGGGPVVEIGGKPKLKIVMTHDSACRFIQELQAYVELMTALYGGKVPSIQNMSREQITEIVRKFGASVK